MEDLIQSLIDTFEFDFIELAQDVWDGLVRSWNVVCDLFKGIVAWWNENGETVKEVLRTVRTLYREATEVVPHLYQQFKDVTSGAIRYRVMEAETVIPVNEVPQFSTLENKRENVLTAEQCREIEMMASR